MKCYSKLSLFAILHKQVPIHGGLRSLSSYWKAFDSNCKNVKTAVRSFSNSSKRRPTICFYSTNVGKGVQCSSIDMINHSFYQSGCSSQVVVVDDSHGSGPNSMIFVESSSGTTGDDLITEFFSKNMDNTDLKTDYTYPEFSMSANGLPVDPPLFSDAVDLNMLSGPETNLPDIVAEINDSIVDTVSGGENILKNSFDTISSSLKTAVSKNVNEVGKFINDITSFINESGESAGSKLTGFSSELKEGSGKAGFVALDVLRRTIIVVEDFVILGAKNIGYAYDSAKEILPQEFQDALTLSEGRVVEVLRPVGTAFQQVYSSFFRITWIFQDFFYKSER